MRCGSLYMFLCVKGKKKPPEGGSKSNRGMILIIYFAMCVEDGVWPFL